MSKRRRRFAAKEKVMALKPHLVEHRPVSDVCDELGIQPGQFYLWQKRLFENGEAAFATGERRPAQHAEAEAARQQAALEAKLRRKDEVLAALMEEHVALKKRFFTDFRGTPPGS